MYRQNSAVTKRAGNRPMSYILWLYIISSLAPSHSPPPPQRASVHTVLGGGCGRVCSGRVVRQWGLPGSMGGAAAQEGQKLVGHTAGECCVDPGVGAWVEAGQQHQDGEGHTWEKGVTLSASSLSLSWEDAFRKKSRKSPETLQAWIAKPRFKS